MGRISTLSPRELEVLALVADGARDAQIASRLHLSARTVESHLRRIFLKLGLDAADGRNRRLIAARAWIEARHAARNGADGSSSARNPEDSGSLRTPGGGPTIGG